MADVKWIYLGSPENLVKRFDEAIAVDEVACHRQGGIFALLGSSGCGKVQTLLRMLAGFENRAQGPHPARQPGTSANPAPTSADQNMMFQS